MVSGRSPCWYGLGWGCVCVYINISHTCRGKVNVTRRETAARSQVTRPEGGKLLRMSCSIGLVCVRVEGVCVSAIHHKGGVLLLPLRANCINTHTSQTHPLQRPPVSPAPSRTHTSNRPPRRRPGTWSGISPLRSRRSLARVCQWAPRARSGGGGSSVCRDRVGGWFVYGQHITKSMQSIYTTLI